MKVALCLSGHIRDFDRINQSLWTNVIATNNSPDVYLHLWDSTDPLSNTPLRPSHFQAIESLKPKELVIQPIRAGHRQPYATCDPPGEEFEEVARTADGRPPGSFYMFYKVWKCHELMRASQQPYDAVIRARPDLIYHNPLNCETLTLSCLSVPDNRHHGGICDALGVGSMEVMDHYAQAFHVHAEEPEVYSERALLAACRRGRVSIREFRMGFTIVRSDEEREIGRLDSPDHGPNHGGPRGW